VSSTWSAAWRDQCGVDGPTVMHVKQDASDVWLGLPGHCETDLPLPLVSPPLPVTRPDPTPNLSPRRCTRAAMPACAAGPLRLGSHHSSLTRVRPTHRPTSCPLTGSAPCRAAHTITSTVSPVLRPDRAPHPPPLRYIRARSRMI